MKSPPPRVGPVALRGDSACDDGSTLGCCRLYSPLNYKNRQLLAATCAAILLLSQRLVQKTYEVSMNSDQNIAMSSQQSTRHPSSPPQDFGNYSFGGSLRNPSPARPTARMSPRYLQVALRQSPNCACHSFAISNRRADCESQERGLAVVGGCGISESPI
jgi:hypothetical protein